MTTSATENWDFYFCTINDKPHSTMVEMALADTAPLNGFVIFHCFEIDLKHPNPTNGMSTDEEFQMLSDLETLIEEFSNAHLVYVARQTGVGKRKYCFYGSHETSLASLIENIESEFPDYQPVSFNFVDPYWQTYFEDIYPNEIGLNEISNRHVLERLESSGDKTEVSRQIDHSVIFKNKKQMAQFKAVAETLGFSVEVASSGFVKKSYDLLVQRVDAPSELDPITLELKHLAKSFEGSYDGWGCYVVTD